MNEELKEVVETAAPEQAAAEAPAPAETVAQEPEAAAAAAAEQVAVINETDGEPIFHADEEAGGGDA